MSELSGSPRPATELDPEDRKLITLARSTRAHNAVAEGAAVRDETGRTYVAGTVALPSLRLSALQAAVALAVASGARSLAAAAIVSEAVTDAVTGDGTGADAGGGPQPGPQSPPSAEERAAVRDLGGPATPILLAGPDGVVRASVTAG